MFNKRFLILLSTLLPLLVAIALLDGLRPPMVMAAPDATITVDTLLDESDGSCADGDCSLRDAIATANAGDVVKFGISGTITLSSAPYFLGELVIDKSLTISGTVPITVSGNNVVRVFNVMTGTIPINVTFDGLVIKNGRDQSTDCDFWILYSCGGGVLIQAGNAAVTVANSTLINNAAQLGGGIFSYGYLVVSDSTFISNSAEYGGAIVSENVALISHSIIAGNTALGGGGIVSNGSEMIIHDSIITRNTATSEDGGGVVNLRSGTMTITDSSFSENTAFTQGGGVMTWGGTVIVHGSTFADNLTGSGGSGIYNQGVAMISNSTFATNLSSTAIGGGIFNDNGTLTVESSTFSGNGAIAPIPVMGSGIFNLNGTLHLYNSILANTSDGTDCYSDNGLTTDVGNLIEANNGCGTPVSTADPLLGVLQDNGGSTLTHALLPGSPAIDAGDPTYPVQADDYDQRGMGFDRVINGRLDIGSYELNQTCTTPIVVTSTLSSGAGTLRQAITDVCHGGLITFDAPLSDQTIDISAGGLITGELVISKSLTISGTVPITVSGNNATRVFNVTSGNVTVDGLTIANGRVQTTDCGIYPSFCGGGIMIQNSGIVFTLTNSALISNTASDAGGGLSNIEGTLIVRDTVFRRNVADGGGGIFNHQGQITINDVRFVNNSAYGGGGGLYNAQGVTEIENGTFADNSAADGGGLYNYGTMTVTHSTLFGNVTFHAGGGTYNGGGGIYNAQGLLTVNNSTLSDNQSFDNGGGIYLYQGTVMLNSSTLSGNTASDGGGLYNSSGTLHLQNTILANSTSNNDCFSGNVLGTDLNNLIEINDGCGTPTVVGDPSLGVLQDNGGSTLTHALLPNSPAIDAGDPAYPVQADDYDQRGMGFDRVINGRLDIGSYELNQTCTTPIVVTSTLSSGAGTLAPSHKRRVPRRPHYLRCPPQRPNHRYFLRW